MGGSLVATRWLVARWLRRRWAAVVPVAVIVALGTTGTVVALGTAQRTSTAYEDYLSRAAVGDVVVNPSISTGEIDRAIRTLPGVSATRSAALFTTTNDDGQPRPRGEVAAAVFDFPLVYGSADGLYIDQDRPAVQDGRLPTGSNEAVLTTEAVNQTGLAIGDEVTLAFWQPATAWVGGEEYAARMADVLEPIGVERIEIVGTVTLADEVLPDDLYPVAKMIVSPDVAARYDCLGNVPASAASVAEIDQALYPPGCATSYRYYSLDMAGGAGDVAPALDEFVRRASALNEHLLEIQDEVGIGAADATQYFLVSSVTAQQVDGVERAMRPMVGALTVLGLAAVIMTVVVAGLLLARELRRVQPDQRPLHDLGVSPVARAVLLATPPLLAAAAGIVIGIVAGWVLGPGPVGLVRAVEPDPPPRLVGIAALAVVAIAVVFVLIVAALALATARRPETQRVAGGGRAAQRVAGVVGSPAIADGLRAAYGRRASLPVIGACAALTGTLAAAALFGVSLSALVSTPRSYGWPWDLAAITGAGYGDLDIPAAGRALDNDPDVASWTMAGFLTEVALDGAPLMSMVVFDQQSDVDVAVMAGELPTRPDEIALGTQTASDRGLDIGDTATLGGAFEPVSVTVSGMVVFPNLGPVLSDRVGTGTGMLLSQSLFDDVELLFETGDIDTLATFVGVDLHEHADTPDVRDRLEGVLSGLDLYDPEPIVLASPIRPPEIIDARSTLTVPVAVGLLFAAVAGVGLGFASWASVRSRRRELAVLRTLGFSSAQVRRSVRVHALATIMAALTIGVPFGVIVGRALWREFANQLGVIPDPSSPWLTVLAVVGTGVLMAVLASHLPAHLAARARPAAGLRTE